MDDDLQRLLRQAEASPGDEALARRVDGALRRAGRDEERRARFRFKFQCPLRFEDLQVRGLDPLVRSCDRCQREVRFVASVDALAEQVAQGQCVAFERRVLGDVVARVADDPRQHSARVEGSPCLVPTDLPWVDLDAFTPTPDLLRVLPGALAREYRAVPVALAPRVLRVACATVPDKVAEDLALMTGMTIELALADGDAVDRALVRLYGPEDEHFLMGDVVAEDPGWLI
ncbi:MAG: hypothetical protein M9894_06870 [Planctomycetes bacterium]|nr:hypothetical protein [Planctomycetota bacterium]